MGGGPRTFPGGLSKWQYKRMHEKLARRKQSGLLRHEKQLYLSRLRSEIRSDRLLPQLQSPPSSSDAGQAHQKVSPMSSRDHIKALADRFMKPGADDLWNEADGPIREPSTGRNWGGRITPRKEALTGRPSWNYSYWNGTDGDKREPPLALLGQKREYSVGLTGASRPPALKWMPWHLNMVYQKRTYSMFAAGRVWEKWRPGSSDTDKSDEEKRSTANVRRDLRFGRLGAFSDEEEVDDGEELGVRAGGGAKNSKLSSAALRNVDAKKERRKVNNSFKEEEEEEEDKRGFAGRIRELQEDVGNRELIRREERRYGLKEDRLLTNTRFDECGISELTVKALTDAGYLQTTVVQEAALPVCLEGKDVLVKAKTGTGKSAAFLLPTIETVLNAMKNNTNHQVSPIYALVLCPTRELAIQLTAEANVLLKYHKGIGVQSLVGGTRFKLDQKRLESDPCQILVATPGRLLDHIENKSGLSVRLMGLKLLVVDEANHLLDLGFRKDIEKITDCLPRQRQSLLFSATIPKEVRRVSQLVLKRDHVFVDTVGLGAVETPTKVQQFCLVVPHELHFHMVHHLLKEHINQEHDYKVIVFCTTAMVTEFMYIMLRELEMNVRETHSRKPQLYRTRISEEFRDSNRLILITSDITARGMNYPDVTLVIQVGIPSDREQYIHRLGRTGRKGKNGKGILLLAPWEEYFLNEISDLPIEKSRVPELDSQLTQKVEESIRTVDASIKEAAYHAWLGYYNSIGEIGREKTTLAYLANRFCQSIGLEKPPALFRKTALKMGFKGVPGIRIRK